MVAPFELKSTKTINLNVALKWEQTGSQNVVAILEGSDPVLKNEYVAIGAHYDHVGSNPYAAGEDKIWNGADDDGSGTVAVMAMAEAFSKGHASEALDPVYLARGRGTRLVGQRLFFE